MTHMRLARTIGHVLATMVFGVSSAIGFAQEGQLDKLTADFRSDSLGCLSLRSAHIVTVPVIGDSTRTEVVLVDGHDLVGRSECLVRDILGRPNKKAYRHHNRGKGKQIETGHLWYYLNNCDQEAKRRTLTFFVANGRVEEVKIIQKSP